MSKHSTATSPRLATFLKSGSGIIYSNLGPTLFLQPSMTKNSINTKKSKERTRDLDHNYLFWSDPTKGSQDQLSKSSRKTSNVFQSRPHFSHGQPYPITFLTHPRISSPKLPTKIVMTDL